MGSSSIAAQLYTLRDFTKTPEAFAETLKKVRDIGYEAVQTSAHGPIEPEHLKQIVDEAGLKIVATHEPYDKLRDNIESVVADHKLWGCPNVAIGGLPGDYRNAEGFAKFARECSEVARKLKKRGLTFGYHNHSFELERFGNRTGLQTLVDESDPEVFNFEIDTYWVQHGGGNPVQWLRKLKGRVPFIHLKDMAMQGSQQLYAEIGEGNLDWHEILEAARDSGVRWYIIEQDTCQRDPFESLAISLRNLKKMGLE